jgi:predicted phosphodiesterase
MKIALISDIHGNLTAFNAVLQDIQQQQVDKIICLGDVATIGPQPREVIMKLRDLGCECIMGNHEKALLDMESAQDFHIAPPLVPGLFWCLEKLQQEDLTFISGFRKTCELKLGGESSLLCFHGSPNSTTDAIYSTTPISDCRRILGDSEYAVLAGGHTHVQMIREYNTSIFVNPGSVGGAFPRPFLKNETPSLQPWAEYALVSFRNNSPVAELQQIPFDTSELQRIVAESNIPVKNWWLEQYQ